MYLFYKFLPGKTTKIMVKFFFFYDRVYTHHDNDLNKEVPEMEWVPFEKVHNDAHGYYFWYYYVTENMGI